MRFRSTRKDQTELSFVETVFKGLASDGGLFKPASEPDLRELIRSFNGKTSFKEIAQSVLYGLFPNEFSKETISALVETAFPFSPQLLRLHDQISILELFHGPSCAFKDFGASFLATLMEHALKKSDRRAVILTATSGDTGSAVAEAFFGKRNIEVVILYPSGRVSPLQEKQLTTKGGNVSALEVDGSFDDCQRMVKEAFLDSELNKQIPLTSANSINLGRLIPQALYYIYGFAQIKEEAPSGSYFSVPSGNFGNLTAGVYAWRWGMPCNGFIAALNANDVVYEYLKSGKFIPRPSIQTYSNAMDVGNPSNFERLVDVFHNSVDEMRVMIHAEVVTDDETLASIRRINDVYNVLVDPHTAVGLHAAELFLEAEGSHVAQAITLSTAHPGKFQEVVKEATGELPELPERLERVLDLPKKATKIGNTLKDLSKFLLSSFA